MADKKISQLTAATTPLAGTEVLPIVQSGSTVKVSAADITAGRNISASGLTLSGGTANGLLYLNASKAASAGSLLTFNETTVNLAGSTRTFRATADSGTAYTSLASDGVYAAGTDLYVFAPASKFVSFYSGGSEKLRLESSGNLIVSTAGKGIDFSANTHAAGMTSELLNWYEEGTWTPTYTTDGVDFTSVTYDPVTSGRYTRIGNKVFLEGILRTDAITVGSATGNVVIGGLPFTGLTNPYGTCSLGTAFDFDGDTPLYGSVVVNKIYLYYRTSVNGGDNNLAISDLGTTGNKNYIYFTANYSV